MADYPAKPVRRIPEVRRAKPPAIRSPFFKTLLKIAETPNIPHLAVTYAQPETAGTVIREITEGKRAVPDGNWAFEERKRTLNNGVRISQLYAVYEVEEKNNG